jgi:hypothetical protein
LDSSVEEYFHGGNLLMSGGEQCMPALLPAEYPVNFVDSDHRLEIEQRRLKRAPNRKVVIMTE